jgi:2-dehydropantoate 2-reductase
MSAIENVVIVGAGAMGAIYARHFDAAESINVAFAASGERAQKLRTDGLIVNGEPLNVAVFDTQADSATETHADLIIVAVKHHQLDAALIDVAALVGPNTQFLSVLNGLDSESSIGARFGADKVLNCIALGMDAVRDGRQVRYANAGRLDFGHADNSTVSAGVERVRAALDAAGLECAVPVEMLRTMWFKFMVNVGVNQASAVMRAPYRVFKHNADARGLMDELMREVIALSQCVGVALNEQDLRRWYAVLDELADDGQTLMLQDVLARRPTEVDVFSGRVVALGEEHGIATPYNRAMLAAIRVLSARAP